MEGSDLPVDMLVEILSRAPKPSIGAVRSTCKQWNDLSKDRILCKGEAKKQFSAFMIKEFKVCSMKFDLYRILHEDVILVKASIKQIEEFNEVKMHHAFHCDGLMLLVMGNMRINFRLVVWNPYLGKIWSIKPRNSYHIHNSSHYWKDWILEKSGSWRSCSIVFSPTSVLLCSKFSANQSRPRTIAYLAKEKIEIINQSFLQYLICLFHHLL
ncbi:PREDICTED: probable F-box protein At1g67455, partial [Camelina sativa]|uniref:Probable F-box protein At1g67455 n=1 Tax=Camelina sativa TaxID=90675 RepID=A0ABM1RPK5_CAMSA